jgi:glucan 1,3-beta-glucosidase
MESPLWHTDDHNVEHHECYQDYRVYVQRQDGHCSNNCAFELTCWFLRRGHSEVTKQYWYDSYDVVRKPYGSSQQSNTVVMIHDAFQSINYWKDFMSSPGWEGVILETHIYQMFSMAENQRSYQEHIAAACAKGSDLTSSTLLAVIGEWSPAANDCARYLNGRGVDARYDRNLPGSIRVGS